MISFTGTKKTGSARACLYIHTEYESTLTL